MQYNFTEEEYLSIAVDLISNDRSESAHPYLNRCLSINNQNAEAWLRKGYCFQVARSHSEAIDCFNNAIDIMPDYPEAHYYRAMSYTDLKEYAKAQGDFNASIDVGGGNYDKYIGLVFALYSQKLYEECNTVCDVIRTEIHFDDHATYRYKYSCLMHLKRFEELTEIAEKQLMSSSQAAEYNNDVGNSWLMRENYARALKWFDIALSHDPEFSVSLNNKGWALYKMGYYDKAYDMFCQAICYNPSDSLPYVNRALYYLQIGAKDNARSDLLKARELNHAINYDAEADLLLQQHFGITPD